MPLLLVASLFLAVWPGAPLASLLLVAMPGAPTVRLPASFGVTNSFAQKLWGSMFLTPPVLLYEVQSFSSALPGAQRSMKPWPETPWSRA